MTTRETDSTRPVLVLRDEGPSKGWYVCSVCGDEIETDPASAPLEFREHVREQHAEAAGAFVSGGLQEPVIRGAGGLPGAQPETACGRVQLVSDDVIATLSLHQWHTTRWGDGRGGFGWKCSCGVMDWGTGAENPERYQRHATRAAASLAAVRHIAEAVSESDGSGEGKEPLVAERCMHCEERAWTSMEYGVSVGPCPLHAQRPTVDLQFGLMATLAAGAGELDPMLEPCPRCGASELRREVRTEQRLMTEVCAMFEITPAEAIAAGAKVTAFGTVQAGVPYATCMRCGGDFDASRDLLVYRPESDVVGEGADHD